MAEDPWATVFNPAAESKPASKGFFGIGASKGSDPWGEVYDPSKENASDSSMAGNIARTTAATILGAKLFLPTTVASGFYGIGKGLASLIGGEGIDKSLESAKSGVETIPGAINSAILTTPESQSYAEKVGSVINWPIEKSRQGWKGLAELATTGNLQGAADVVTGQSEGSNISVPIVGSLAEANALAALFGRPGTKEVPFRKAGTLDETINLASGHPAPQRTLVPLAEHGAVVMAGEKIGEGARALRDKLAARKLAKEAGANQPEALAPTPAPTVPGRPNVLDEEINAQMDALPSEMKTAIEVPKSVPLTPEEIAPPAAGTEVFLDGTEKAGEPVGLKEPSPIPEQPAPPLTESTEKWYRGKIGDESPNGDRFYTSDPEVAAGFGRESLSTEPSVSKLKETPQKTYTTSDKTTLGEELGIKIDPYAKDGYKFDAEVKNILSKQGYDSVKYMEGTLGAEELHVFGKENIAPAEVQTGGSFNILPGESRSAYIQRLFDRESFKAKHEGNPPGGPESVAIIDDLGKKWDEQQGSTKSNQPLSIKELAVMSDEAQSKIDAKHDELAGKGLTWEQQNADPELKKLYDERIGYDSRAAIQGYEGAKNIVENELQGIPHDSLYASVDSILREHYSLTGHPDTGAYMMSKYTGEALSNPVKTIQAVAKDITKLLVEKDYPGGDFWTLMESNLSALTDQAKRKYIQEGIAKAEKINDKIKEFFLKSGKSQEVAAAANEAATSPANLLPEPTQAQKEAGNYKLGHTNVQGLDISIENPAGSIRKGVDENGKPWETPIEHHYGYIKKSTGKDGDHVDTFIGPNPESAKVYIVDQKNPKTGKFDEHKTLVGFNSLEEARAGYLANYDKSGPSRIMGITEMPIEKFKEWLKGDTTKRVSKSGQEAVKTGGKQPWEMMVTVTPHSESGRPWKIEAKDKTGTDAGYGLISELGPKQYLMNTVFVNEGYRRQGINGAIVERAAEEIRKYDGGKLFFDKREATDAGRAFIENLDKKGLLGENKIIPGHGIVTEYKNLKTGEILPKELPPGPGAKTAGTPPETPSDISQLTGTLDSVQPRKEPSSITLPKLSVGIQKSVDMFSRVKAAADAAWKNFKTEPVWTTYDKIMGDYDLSRTESGLDALKWGADIQAKVPKSLQAAITNYVDVGGDQAKLLDFAKRSKDPTLAKGYADAANLPPDLKLLAENVRQYQQSWLDKLQEAGVLGDQFVENYIKHIWGNDNALVKRVSAEVNAGLFRTNPSLARQRILETYFEGEQLGLIPKDKRVGFLVAAYAKEASEALAARKAVQDMFTSKAPDGKPLIIPQEATAKRIDSKEYAIMDPERESGRAVRVFDTREEADVYLREAGKEGLAIEPRDRSAIFITPKMRQKDAVTTDGRAYRPGPNHPALKQYVWSISDAEGNPVFYKGDALIHPDIYDNLSNALKTSDIRKSVAGRAALQVAGFAKQTMLSLSVFHPVQLAIHAIGHTVDIAHLKPIDITQPVQRLAVSHGLNIYEGSGLQAFQEGVWGGGLVDRIPGIGIISQKLGQYTFQDLLPRLKMNMFMDAFERNSKRYAGKLTEDQIASKTADQANAAFGGLNYRKMGRNPTFQDALRLTLLAPDFLEARIRFAGQALGAKWTSNTEQAAAMVRLALGMFVVARVANKFLDDDYHWDRPLSLVYKGQEFALRSVPGDIIHAIIDPRSFVYHRLNPTVTRTLIEGLTGRDMYGKERDLSGQVKDLTVTHLPIPFQGPFRKGDQQLWESAVSSMGLSTYKYKTKAERELSRILSLTIPQKQMDAEESAMANAKAKMKQSIREGTPLSQEIMKEINKLAPEQARRVLLDATRYTRFEDGFEHLNIRDALKVYNKTRGIETLGADPKERETAARLITKKYVLAAKHNPNQIMSLTDGEKADLREILKGAQ